MSIFSQIFEWLWGSPIDRKPGAPTNLSYYMDNGIIYINWTPAPDIDYQHVIIDQYDETGHGVPQLLNKTISATQSFLKIVDVVEKHKYIVTMWSHRDRMSNILSKIIEVSDLTKPFPVTELNWEINEWNE